ncbi:MAG TPA: chemotaxis protein CheW [Wenzhouxiangella sp.]|nr:chemotaxis protein CheW [Wenzhouxiangella sp.]
MSAGEIRCVLVPVTQAELLLPNAAVAEVAAYTSPEPIAGTPDWMPGTILWRGWQVPLIHFSVLAGLAEQEDASSARLCVLKSLIGSERMPYFALLAQGFPRLTTVDRSSMTTIENSADSVGVAGRVLVEGSTAIIPDLDQLADLGVQGAFGALPASDKPS